MANIHLKSAWDHVRRSPFQALAAFFVLSVTFFVITLLLILLYSSDQAITYFETRPQIIAFLKDEIDDNELGALQQKYANDERVEKVNYVSKEEALDIYKSATSDNPLLSELVSPSIFPASVEISLKDLSSAQDVIAELEKEDSVDQVGFTASLGKEESLYDVVARLKRVAFYLRVGGGGFAAVQVATSFLVLLVIISMRIRTRREEIETLKLIGATSGFIRNPIILEALIYAFGGVFLGWLFAFILILYSTPSLVAYFGDIPILPRDTISLFTIFSIILGAELLIGFILATTGSFLAVSRVKKK
jgi:cell division transport system permease protein